MVRAYTNSADTRHLNYYYDIIAIRQGEKAAPEEYGLLYWAEVMAGGRTHAMPADRPGRSLQDRMKSQGFSAEEFATVDKILACSQTLFEQDQIAFAATQGLYDPVRRTFTDEGEPQPLFANQLVNSGHYLGLEYNLLREVETFAGLTDDRTSRMVQQVSSQLSRSIYAAIIILALTVALVLVAMLVIRRKVLAPMKALTNKALGFGTGDYSIRAATGHGVLELQALAQTFNAMAANIEEDISQREKIHQELEIATLKAEESTRAKSMFLANMSHEIRTPMNAIIGMTFLALQTGLNMRQQDYIDKIQLAAQSLLRVINDILDYSKIEAGKLELENVPFRLEDSVSNVLILQRQYAMDKGLELLLDLRHPGLFGDAGTFLGDPLRLEQVLTNLLTNAIKFTDHGSIRISLREQSRNQADCDLQILVVDTGIGMTAEQVDRLFQEFTQADGSTTRRHGGTGLGLSIVKRLIEQMGGQISVTSEPGAGTCFTIAIRLPLAPGEGPEGISPATGQTCRALIADDHESARLMLQTMLGHLGMESTLADSGEAALQLLLSEASFDIAFIDWGMPGMSGEELITAIRALPAVKQPVIVAVSAYDQERIHELCGQDQLCYYLPKPVLPKDLRPLLQLAQRQATAENTAAPVVNADRLKDMRVLLVEDNEFNQQIASEMLTYHGVQVDIAGNGQEALDMVAAHADDHYHAVLMDIQMPVMDGYEATRLLRAQPKYISLPIIAMTAHALVEEKEHCRAIGMTAHVAKPFELEDLLLTLARCCTETGGPAGPPSTTETDPRAVAGIKTLLPAAIPGVDLANGLRLCAGKVGLYRGILEGYARDHITLADSFRTLLEQGRWDEISALAHTFKGLSGTISAGDLEKLAAAIEQGARGRSPNLLPLIEKMEEKLSPTLAALHAFFAERESGWHVPVPGPLDAAETGQLMNQLRQLLGEADSAARDFWHNHESSLKPMLPPRSAQQLARAISNFQFEEALALLTASQGSARCP